MERSSLDVIRGTLDVLILKTLSWGALHGYAITDMIQRQTDDAILVEEGALYPALYRMEAKGWIESEWGLSDNNRRAKYYTLTAEGRRQLRVEKQTWERYAEAVGKVLGAVRKPEWEKR
ncbi:MAG TPA: PadR family transcriptional regulator [Candidatus Solibacter sp.]|nr:PadR family transcriptional regulator [Candidatus Solibacter sp.]